jgi:hypothetical protein
VLLLVHKRQQQLDGAGQEEALDCPQELLHCVVGELGKQIRYMFTARWIGCLIHVFLIFLSLISWVHELGSAGCMSSVIYSVELVTSTYILLGSFLIMRSTMGTESPTRADAACCRRVLPVPSLLINYLFCYKHGRVSYNNMLTAKLKVFQREKTNKK